MGDAPPNSLYSNFKLLAVLLSYAFGIVQGPSVTVACLEFKHIPLCVHDCTVLVDRGHGKTIRLDIFVAHRCRSQQPCCDKQACFPVGLGSPAESQLLASSM